MSTTSTVPAAITSLLTLFNNALTTASLADVRAFESWPGTDAAREMVVFGEVEWDEYEIASIKAGRQRRDEDWAIGFEVYVIGKAETTPKEPVTARDRAFAILAALESALADTPRGGLSAPTVDWVQVRPTVAGPRVFEQGWAYRVAGRIHVHARLT